MLEEVIVTATKRTQTLSEVAGSISALSAAAIAKRSIDNVEDLQGMVPNLLFRDHLGSRLLAIRGVGNNVATGIVEPGVAAHLDGVYLARGDMLAVDFNDLERVEVLRGPQGTLYGKNATGGTVNFISKAPTEEFEGRVSLGGGSFGGQRASFMLSGPLGDALRYRLSAFTSEDDGFFENTWTGNDIGGGEKSGLRFALAMDFGEDWTGTLGFFTQDADLQSAQPNFALDTATLPNAIAASPTADPPGFGATVVDTDEWHEVAQFFDPVLEMETEGLTLSIAGGDAIAFTSTTGLIDHVYGPNFYAFGGIVSGFLSGNMQGPFGTIGVADDPRVQDSATFSQEFTLSGESGSLSWLVGLFHFTEEFDSVVPFFFTDEHAQTAIGAATRQALIDMMFPMIPPVGLRSLGQRPVNEEETENTALFVDLEWSISDSWRLNLGGRYASEEKVTVQNNTAFSEIPLPDGSFMSVAAPACPNPVFGLTGLIELEESGFSPKLRLEGDLGTALFYAQYQEAVRSGQAGLLCNEFVEAEELAAFEVGYKLPLGDQGAFNLTAFAYDYENAQTLDFPPGGQTAVLLSVPGVEVLGTEIEFAYVLSAALSVDLALTLMDSEITDGGAPFIDLYQLQPHDVTGNPWPGSPEFTFQAGLDYQRSFAGGFFHARLEYAQFAEQAFRLFGVGELHSEDGEDSYALVNLYATLSLADERYVLRSFVRNATDEEYKYWNLFSVSTGFSGTAAPPLTWGLDLTLNF